MRGHDNYQRCFRRRVVAVRLKFLKKVEAADARKVHIKQEHIEFSIAHQDARCFGTVSLGDLSAESFQRTLNAIPRSLFVIHHQQSQAILFHLHSPEFNTMRARMPVPPASLESLACAWRASNG